ncbi:MAG: glycerol kinase GlpK [Thalassobaculaceae bacterium]
MAGHIVAIDQGTTSTRALIFDDIGDIIASAQQEFRQEFPNPGWVEHDPEAIWQSVVTVLREAVAQAQISAHEIAAIGLTNQRETTVIWERASGRPIHPAIVWQDRRTAKTCLEMADRGLQDEVNAVTGLRLDPYFSATKIAWILDHVDGARAAAACGELAFGTIDSFLLWRLTGGGVHRTDATNASRTLLYDLAAGDWSADMCALFNVPMSLLPAVADNASDFGVTTDDLLGGAIAIGGMAGDQQAATIGQACFQPGMLKATYGTGCFALLNTGRQRLTSRNRLLTTLAYQLDGQPTFALEGSIFIAGAAVQWLRDGLGIIDHAAQSGALAADADPDQEVYLVPAFVGLGAPYWDAECRGALYGLTRATGRAEIARAALESVCFQSHDLIAAMRGDWPDAEGLVLRVDGGMVASDWTMQRLADLLAAPVDRPIIPETTAMGAAYLAGLQSGLYPGPDEFAKTWALEQRFTPRMDAATRARKHAGWRDAVERTLSRPAG